MNNTLPTNPLTLIDLYHFTNKEFKNFNLGIHYDKGTYQCIREVGFWFTENECWGEKFIKDKPTEKYWKWSLSVEKDLFFPFKHETDYRVIQTEFSHDNLFFLKNACKEAGYIGWIFENPCIDCYLDYNPHQYVIWDKDILLEAKCSFCA